MFSDEGENLNVLKNKKLWRKNDVKTVFHWLIFRLSNVDVKKKEFLINRK